MGAAENRVHISVSGWLVKAPCGSNGRIGRASALSTKDLDRRRGPTTLLMAAFGTAYTRLSDQHSASLA